MVPFTEIAAPVFILFKVSSGVFSKSITHCILFIVEPSFKAIKRLLLKVLTQPFITTYCKTVADFNNSATLFFVIIFIYCNCANKLCFQYNKYTFFEAKMVTNWCYFLFLSILNSLIRWCLWWFRDHYLFKKSQ